MNEQEQVTTAEKMREAQTLQKTNQKALIEKAIQAKAEKFAARVRLGELRAENQEAMKEKIRVGSIALFGGFLFGIFIGR